MFSLWKLLYFGAFLNAYTLHAATIRPEEVIPEFVPLEAGTQDSKHDPMEANKTATAATDAEPIEDYSFWHKIGMEQLKKIVSASQKRRDPSYLKKAKNIIVFIGDGMGMTSITAGRIYKGQYLNKSRGEEETLAFDNFMYTGMAKTYNVDKQVPDSAGTATAMFSGIKTYYGAIGVDVTRNMTNGTQGNLLSIMDWAQAAGKRTGIVTTTRITHATPAATYARIYHRDWECDTMVPAEAVGHHVDIARQLVERAPGNKMNVIMGGGLSPMGALNDQENYTVNFEGSTETICKRGDNRNLPQEWLKQSVEANDTREFVQTIDQLKQIDVKKVDRVMGLFRNNHITYSIAREEGEPSLKEMVEAAIGVLDRGKESKGFVLMVEGGRIDQAHHQNYARAALREVVELDLAVEAALNMIDQQETLVIVTADHSHSMTLNGYPKRGADILGFANKSDDPMIYETITYANGPGYWTHLAPQTGNKETNRSIWIELDKLSESERAMPTYRHMAMVPREDETHGGEDVVVFANGPGSSLVHGVFEQNYLAYVMSYVGCMGPARKMDTTCNKYNGASAYGASVLLLVVTTALTWFYF